MYPFHQQVQEFFPDFDYHNPRPEVWERRDFRRPDNIMGHQQRAVTCFWALKQCSPTDLGLDLGSPKGLTPYCLAVDVFGNGAEHPFYGGRYLADVAHDAVDVSIFPENAWPYIASNHSIEHMPADGDEGVIDLLVRWIALLRQGGVLAMVVPDNDYFDVLASDRDHKHAWGAKDFRPRVLDRVLEKTSVELVEYNGLDNHFSFNVVLRKQ